MMRFKEVKEVTLDSSSCMTCILFQCNLHLHLLPNSLRDDLHSGFPCRVSIFLPLLPFVTTKGERCCKEDEVDEKGESSES